MTAPGPIVAAQEAVLAALTQARLDTAGVEVVTRFGESGYVVTEVTHPAELQEQVYRALIGLDQTIGLMTDPRRRSIAWVLHEPRPEVAA